MDGGATLPLNLIRPLTPRRARWRLLPVGCRKKVTRASLSPARVQQLETHRGPDWVRLGRVTRESSVGLEKFICVA